MFEKVNKFHPDKVADRIAGAVVDLAYKKHRTPKVACEVLIGHGAASVIVEASVAIRRSEIRNIIKRIAGEQRGYIIQVVPQDKHLAENQQGAIRCGDNGIFKGNPITSEQKRLAAITQHLTQRFPSDGKYVISEKYDRDSKGQEIADVDNHENGQRGFSPSDERNVQRDERTGGTIGGYSCIICQSKATQEQVEAAMKEWETWNDEHIDTYTINPLGEWTGGTNVDSGATNRKLGSDMGDSVTGGGLHGKDLSKADVSVNIVCHLLAQTHKKPVEAYCAIGDEDITFYMEGEPMKFRYEDVVRKATDYISALGGFEKFAELGLIR